MIDSVSVEELDCSAESQVLIPAEHLCVTLNADLVCIYMLYFLLSLSLSLSLSSLSLSLSLVAKMEQKQAIWCLKRKSL